jgi:type I restriction enzyme M protein
MQTGKGQQKSLIAENLFCRLSDLTNEASVEAWFISKLLDHLGYAPEDIKLKTSLKEFKVGKGSKSEFYKPDYIVQINGFPVLVIDAKNPSENIEDWTAQCSSYCLELNKEYPQKPVEYFLISNGFKTSLYKWDERNSKVDLDFADFRKGNVAFTKLVGYVSKTNLQLLSNKKQSEVMESEFELRRVSTGEISDLFTRIHNFIWRTEKKTPSAAFEELMKIVFIKLKKDRELNEKFGTAKPKTKDVVFSVAWIKNQTEQENPINDPLFRNLVTDLEKEIIAKNKKRIFEADEDIELNPSTIEKIVSDFEHIDLSAMDDGETDIHGRMFETFLNATIRGKDLGQYFTPRDIVELMVKLANIKVEKDANEYKIENVLDACCGSGGFLISAMNDMLEKARNLVGVSDQELKAISQKIVDESIMGIDAGSAPPIYRIARMNMYLHGDGGSNIFFADSLNKNIGQVGKSNLEIDEQIKELRKIMLDEKTKFDVILSNPPFSLTYSRKHKEQKEIMDQYELSTYNKASKSLLSSLMFLERYKDLVSKDGRILAIIDESVLSGEKYQSIRDYIREKFIIKAIISLPGDAFRRQGSRVKTSILILRPKHNSEEQPELFMETSVYLGLTEKIANRIGIGREELLDGKKSEAQRILSAYRLFEKGSRSDTIIDASAIGNRLDVKYCLTEKGKEEKKKSWLSKNVAVMPLGQVLSPARNRKVRVDDEKAYTMLKVTYDGEVLEADTKEGQELSYSALYCVREWDILLSSMGMGRGAIGIVQKYYDGKYVSSEYSILTANSKEEALYYTNILRTKEILGDVLSSATGMNRGRIRWKTLSNIDIPIYDRKKSDASTAVKTLEKFWENYSEYQDNKAKALHNIVSELELEDEKARKRWLAYKPPE